MNDFVRQIAGPWRVALTAVLVAAVSAPAVAAQEEGTTKLRGMVFDSTEMSVLAGARVAVMGTTVTGQTNQQARCSIGLRDIVFT